MSSLVHRLTVIAAALVCALAAASGVLAAGFGANDDGALYAPDGGESFYATMSSVGLRQSVITVRWSPSAPAEIPNQEHIDRVVPIAVRHGIEVVLAVYPYPPREVEAGLGTPAAFAEWAATVARRYPAVRQFIVGNEPNQPAFWRPQFGADGRNVSAAAFGRYLAAAYDALKAVDPELRVVGVGLSPRGNDNPRARSNISTSPVRFLTALGRWYRTSGRTLPLMDGLSFHPYPNRATDSIGIGYAWPGAGFVNLPRIKQALWDAFHGTPQPTTLEGLKLYLDEVGWQVDTSFGAGYVEAENVPVTDESTQAFVYGQIVRRAKCDPDVAEVNVFGFIDDRDRRGFQAALHRVDGTPRPSADAVRAALLDETPCPPAAPWQPTTSVVGVVAPQVTATGRRIVVSPRIAEGVTVTACAYPRRVSPTVAQRLPASVGGSPATCVTAKWTPGRPTAITLPRAASLRNGGTVGVRLVAEANADRATSFGARFR
jgi:hypothetical protein